MNLISDVLIDLSVSAGLGGFPLERRHALIAEAAYFRAEARGFAPGGDIDDWLDAESEIDERLAAHGWGADGAGG